MDFINKSNKITYSARVYLSGPISADPDAARESFAETEQALRLSGFLQIVNPEERLRGLSMTHGEILRVCRELLRCCDVLVLHGDWRKSPGACMEIGMAMVLGLTIVEFDGSDLRALDY